MAQARRATDPWRGSHFEEDDASAKDEESSEERDVQLEREDPPERADPPQREPESQQNVVDRGDPFENMEELAAWRRAEDRFLGIGIGSGDDVYSDEYSD